MTATIFAVSASILLGFAALGTEVGYWYVVKIQAYNKADAAAMEGVIEASQAGNAVAPNNSGFPTTASVSVPVVPILASIFGVKKFQITVSSTAQLKPLLPACALSLSGPLTIAQPVAAEQVGIQCYLASNGAVNITTNQSIGGWGITSVADCSGCPSLTPPDEPADPTNPTDPINGDWPTGPWYNPNATTNPPYPFRPNSAFQPPTTDPYAPLIPAMPTSFTAITGGGSGGVLTPSTGDGTNCPMNTGTICAYYNTNITLPSGATTQLPPGTYFFVNSSLTIPSNATVVCWAANALPPSECFDANGGSEIGPLGVTIVMIGTAGGSTGTLTIAPNATVRLDAQAIVNNPATGATDSLWAGMNGILFYRDEHGDYSKTGVDIADGAGNSRLNGVMYFPTSIVYFAANNGSDILQPTCSVIVGAKLTLGYSPSSPAIGGPPIQLNADCGGVPPMPMTQLVTVTN